MHTILGICLPLQRLSGKWEALFSGGVKGTLFFPLLSGGPNKFFLIALCFFLLFSSLRSYFQNHGTI
jgi:hypothetical protein